jgi:hypothetical protein
MPSECLAVLQPEPEPPNLEFYRVRDRLTRAYSPRTEKDRVLLDQMARAWIHLQSMYQMKDEVLAQRSLADLFLNDPAQFKLLNRAIIDAERMWRYAQQAFLASSASTAANPNAGQAAGLRAGNQSALPRFHLLAPTETTPKQPAPAPSTKKTSLPP